MAEQPRVRLAILARTAINRPYSEIANELGISKYDVQQTVNHAKEQAANSSPEEMLTAEFITGSADRLVY